MATDTTCRKSQGHNSTHHVHCIYLFVHNVHVHETQMYTHKITIVMCKKPIYFSLQLNTTVVTTLSEALPLIS